MIYLWQSPVGGRCLTEKTRNKNDNCCWPPLINVRSRLTRYILKLSRHLQLWSHRNQTFEYRYLTTIFFNKYGEETLSGAVVNVLECDIVVSEFELQPKHSTSDRKLHSQFFKYVTIEFKVFLYSRSVAEVKSPICATIYSYLGRMR